MSLLLLALSLPALAGERLFAWTYGAGTVPKGGVELEHYLTATGAWDAPPDWEHQVELEYGITDNLEAGLYLVAAQPAGGALSFTEYKARLRYRFGAMGVGFVDPALYLEYAGAVDGHAHEIEAKVILEKDVDRLALALNVEGAVDLEPEGDEVEAEFEFAPSLGVGVHVAKWLVLGVEARAEYEVGEDELPAWVGPAIHVSGAGGRFWWTVTPTVGITPAALEGPALSVRSLLALNL